MRFFHCLLFILLYNFCYSQINPLDTNRVILDRLNLEELKDSTLMDFYEYDSSESQAAVLSFYKGRYHYRVPFGGKEVVINNCLFEEGAIFNVDELVSNNSVYLKALFIFSSESPLVSFKLRRCAVIGSTTITGARSARFINTDFYGLFETFSFHNFVSLTFEDVDFHSFVNLRGRSDTIRFIGVTTSKEINLNLPWILGPDSARLKKTVIDLSGSQIEKFDLDYSNYTLYDGDRSTLTSIEFNNFRNVYTQLLKNLQNRGYTTEQLDKDYKRFLYLKDPGRSKFWGSVLNFLDEQWWGYGYEKQRVPMWTAIFLGIFFLLNVTVCSTSRDVYSIRAINSSFERFEEESFQQGAITTKTRIKEFFKGYLLVFYHTAIVFFGLKMSIDNIDFNRPVWVAYIFLQYTLGLVCLAYLVDFVISSPQGG